MRTLVGDTFTHPSMGGGEEGSTVVILFSFSNAFKFVFFTQLIYSMQAKKNKCSKIENSGVKILQESKQSTGHFLCRWNFNYLCVAITALNL